MNNLQIFKNEQFGEIRTVSIDNEPWFVGKDVAVALGYSDAAQAMRKRVDPEDKGVVETTTPGGKQNMTIINESGLYSLVLSSKLPSAKQFKRWVTSEVLPSIRKHGAYMTPVTVDMMIKDPEFGIKLLGELKAEQDKRRALEVENEIQRQVIADYEPKANYYDAILNSTGTMTTTQIAADYDMSAKKLNKILHEAGLQYRCNEQWVLYRKHMGKGLTKSKTITITRSDGREVTKLNTEWTQKGRLEIHRILEKRGIVALMDKEKE